MDNLDSQSRKSNIYAHPCMREIEQYKFGEKGHLLPFYTTTLLDWFEHCVALGKLITYIL